MLHGDGVSLMRAFISSRDDTKALTNLIWPIDLLVTHVYNGERECKNQFCNYFGNITFGIPVDGLSHKETKRVYLERASTLERDTWAREDL